MKLKVTTATHARITIEVVHFIKEWRLHRGLSVEKLGKLCGVSGSMISQLERGKTTYTQRTLEAIAKALQVQTWQLLACKPDENRELWNIVLSSRPSPLQWSDFATSERPALEEMLNNNCDAAIKSARTMFAKGRRDKVEAD